MFIFNRMRMYGAVGPICSAQLPFQPALLQPGGKISPGTAKDDFVVGIILHFKHRDRIDMSKKIMGLSHPMFVHEFFCFGLYI